MAFQRADGQLERPVRRARRARPLAVPRRRDRIDEGLRPPADRRRIRSGAARRARGHADDPAPGFRARIRRAGASGPTRGAGPTTARRPSRFPRMPRSARTASRMHDSLGARRSRRDERAVGPIPRRGIPRAADARAPAAGRGAAGQSRPTCRSICRFRISPAAAPADCRSSCARKSSPSRVAFADFEGYSFAAGDVSRRAQRGRRLVRALRRLYVCRSRLQSTRTKKPRTRLRRTAHDRSEPGARRRGWGSRDGQGCRQGLRCRATSSPSWSTAIPMAKR